MEDPLTQEAGGHPGLPELAQLQDIVAASEGHLEVRTTAGAQAPGTPALPVVTVSIGSARPDAPALALLGGVHGLERIGSRVVLGILASLVARLPWDETLHRQLEQVRLVFMPIVNPGGMLRGTRANPHGVDLMRNGPADAADPVPFLVGGQRMSPGLPWYRGRRGEPMEAESQALCHTIATELLPRPFSLALDCHSGFGLRDRLWFPYAGRRIPFAQLAELHALHHIFESAHGHHPYVFEPQSRQYLAHGDLWDHLCGEVPAGHVFLPLTLEMGSWLWVKKNPRQFFSRHGLFNPQVAHREQRVMRRHLPLVDFLVRAAIAHRRWLPDAAQAEDHRRRAMALWFGERRT